MGQARHQTDKRCTLKRVPHWRHCCACRSWQSTCVRAHVHMQTRARAARQRARRFNQQERRLRARVCTCVCVCVCVCVWCTGSTARGRRTRSRPPCRRRSAPATRTCCHTACRQPSKHVFCSQDRKSPPHSPHACRASVRDLGRMGEMGERRSEREARRGATEQERRRRGRERETGSGGGVAKEHRACFALEVFCTRVRAQRCAASAQVCSGGTGAPARGPAGVLYEPRTGAARAKKRCRVLSYCVRPRVTARGAEPCHGAT